MPVAARTTANAVMVARAEPAHVKTVSAVIAARKKPAVAETIANAVMAAGAEPAHAKIASAVVAAKNSKYVPRL